MKGVIDTYQQRCHAVREEAADHIRTLCGLIIPEFRAVPVEDWRGDLLAPPCRDCQDVTPLTKGVLE